MIIPPLFFEINLFFGFNSPQLAAVKSVQSIFRYLAACREVVHWFGLAVLPATVSAAHCDQFHGTALPQEQQDGRLSSFLVSSFLFDVHCFPRFFQQIIL
jgi:hypothetical protein